MFYKTLVYNAFCWLTACAVNLAAARRILFGIYKKIIDFISPNTEGVSDVGLRASDTPSVFYATK